MWKEPEYYDREKLYNEVWEQPVTKVAEQYGVSDVAIAKVCRKMRIPVPGRGYWRKLQTSQKMKKIPLPKYKDCPKVLRACKPQEEVEQKEVVRLVPEAFVLEKQLLQQEESPEMHIEFDPSVSISNKYVKQTGKKLEKSKKQYSKASGFGRCYSSDDKAFEVSVGPDNIPRVLAILQTLCNELEKRGYSIGVKPKEPTTSPQYQQYGYFQKEPIPIYIRMLDAFITIKTTEKSKKVTLSEKERKNTYQDYEYNPTGELCFEITNSSYESYARTKWKDGKKQKVQDSLHEIIISLIKVATMQKEDNAQAAERHRLWEIEEKKRREQERLKKIEQERIDIMLKDSERLVGFKQLKDYVKVITAVGKERLEYDYPDSDFSKWVEWAEGILERNDPRSWDLPKFDIAKKYWYY